MTRTPFDELTIPHPPYPVRRFSATLAAAPQEPVEPTSAPVRNTEVPKAVATPERSKAELNAQLQARLDELRAEILSSQIPSRHAEDPVLQERVQQLKDRANSISSAIDDHAMPVISEMKSTESPVSTPSTSEVISEQALKAAEAREAAILDDLKKRKIAPGTRADVPLNAASRDVVRISDALKKQKAAEQKPITAPPVQPPAPTTAPAPERAASSTRAYNVGDIYTEGAKRTRVLEVDDTGRPTALTEDIEGTATPVPEAVPAPVPAPEQAPELPVVELKDGKKIRIMGKDAEGGVRGMTLEDSRTQTAPEIVPVVPTPEPKPVVVPTPESIPTTPEPAPAQEIPESAPVQTPEPQPTSRDDFDYELGDSTPAEPQESAPAAAELGEPVPTPAEIFPDPEEERSKFDKFKSAAGRFFEATGIAEQSRVMGDWYMYWTYFNMINEGKPGVVKYQEQAVKLQKTIEKQKALAAKATGKKAEDLNKKIRSSEAALRNVLVNRDKNLNVVRRYEGRLKDRATEIANRYDAVLQPLEARLSGLKAQSAEYRTAANLYQERYARALEQLGSLEAQAQRRGMFGGRILTSEDRAAIKEAKKVVKDMEKEVRVQHRNVGKVEAVLIKVENQAAPWRAKKQNILATPAKYKFDDIALSQEAVLPIPPVSESAIGDSYLRNFRETAPASGRQTAEQLLAMPWSKEFFWQQVRQSMPEFTMGSTQIPQGLETLATERIAALRQQGQVRELTARDWFDLTEKFFANIDARSAQAFRDKRKRFEDVIQLDQIRPPAPTQQAA